MEKTKVQPGTTPADKKFRITILGDGPYLVFGQPPLSQQFIVPNSEGNSWDFAEGLAYKCNDEPTALCRCGESKNKPYCDGAHVNAAWDPRLTASGEPLLSGAEVFEGPEVSLTDNESYCVFARFCDAKGRVWNLVGQSDDPAARELTVREANMCPGGRLSAWDNKTQKPFEPVYAPSLALIEDPALHVSGGLWVRGGIAVQKENGDTYEVRNRVVLCRCGQSSNKPFCDGTHASMKFRDGLPDKPGK
ncbi:CDGSH iron-sulfur domain-containing protein [Alistipes sp. OttesenSCG-928-B03]|nr:CDGSH iron-sulfur domain-containing protein [Alistipes sp. OttesenSCG-928-B03]